MIILLKAYLYTFKYRNYSKKSLLKAYKIGILVYVYNVSYIKYTVSTLLIRKLILMLSAQISSLLSHRLRAISSSHGGESLETDWQGPAF